MDDQNKLDQIEMFPDFQSPDPEPAVYSPYQDQPERRCPLCHALYAYDRNGMARHPRGEGRKCRGTGLR